tara:strand:+ start:460 stop:705 length:246 start_codon:yes stop_codon:yes gene_type:complete
MPMGKAYGMKEMQSVSKQGEMSPIPDGQLYREGLEGDIVGPTNTSFTNTLDAPTKPGSIHNQEKAIFAMADDYSIYNTSGK